MHFEVITHTHKVLFADKNSSFLGWNNKKPDSLHRVRKKESGASIASSNTGRFLKIFHYYNQQEICNKAIVKYPTTP